MLLVTAQISKTHKGLEVRQRDCLRDEHRTGHYNPIDDKQSDHESVEKP